MKKIEEVVEYFGSKGKLARVLGISPAAISRWVKYIPKGRAYEIEVITDGKFKVKDLVNPKL